MAKDPHNRIRELERHCEALENALEEVRAAVFEPKTTLPRLKHRVGQILVSARDREPEP
jgi:hypothetical protein